MQTQGPRAVIQTEKFAKLEVTSSQGLREWLEDNHRTEDSIWLVTWKASVPDKYLSTSDVLDELVAFGWIDGIRRKLDDTRTMQLISPRKAQHWSKSYKDRAARLIDEDRMAPAGLAAIARSKRDGLWSFMDDVDALSVPDDLQTALSRNADAMSYFDAAPASYRRNLLRWVKLAKTDATRRKRIAAIVDASAKAERLPQM